ncbi:MAG: hypothetical protein ABI867_28405, partial [Kofleriaceae bacterium]
VANVRDAVAVVSADSLACAIRKSGDLVCGEHADMTAAWRPLLGIAKVDSLAMAGESEPRACTVSAGAVQCFTIAGSFEAGPLRVIEREDRTELRGASHLAFGTDLPPGYERGRRILEAVVAGKIIRFAPDDREDIPVLADAVKHVAGCAVRAGGSVVCWGRNEGGVLAQPTTLGTAHVPPTRVPGIRDVVDLALATTKTFALTGDGQLYAWGSLVRFGATSRPERVKLGLGPTMLVQIGATPDGLGCMRSAAGEVWCQVDPMAQLGPPRLEQLDTEAVQTIAASDKVVLALRADGVLETHALQVLEGVAMLAVAAPADADVVEVASRYDRVCTRTRAGAVRCPSVIAGIDAASAIAVGDDFACALQRGTVACWHYDADRKLSPATQVATIRDATDLAAATDYACAVHGAGRVACWHFTKAGSAQTPVEVLAAGAVDVELGYGTADQLYRSRYQLHGPPAGGEYGCAIMTDRTVTCWGMHLFGELGDGSLVESTSPIGVVL